MSDHQNTLANAHSSLGATDPRQPLDNYLYTVAPIVSSPFFTTGEAAPIWRAGNSLRSAETQEDESGTLGLLLGAEGPLG